IRCCWADSSASAYRAIRPRIDTMMSVLRLSIKHGRTLEEARIRVESTVHEVQSRFGPLVERVEWGPNHDSVTLFGAGAEIGMHVDAHELHVTADVPVLGRLLGAPLLAGLKSVIQQHFPKHLPNA